MIVPHRASAADAESTHRRRPSDVSGAESDDSPEIADIRGSMGQRKSIAIDALDTAIVASNPGTGRKRKQTKYTSSAEVAIASCSFL